MDETQGRLGTRRLAPGAVRRLARLGGWLYAIAGTGTLLFALQAREAVENLAAVVTVALFCVVVGVALMAVTSQLREETLERLFPYVAYAYNAGAGIVQTLGLFWIGPSIGIGTIVYMAAPIFAVYLFRTLIAISLIAAIGVEYGVLLVREPEVPARMSQWLFLMTFMSATAIIIGGLVTHADDLALSEREARDDAAEANRQKSAFLAAMSHELRTPMNAILGFSEVLEQQVYGDLNVKQTEYIHDVVGSGQHLLSLINDILDLAKVEAGRMELAVHPVDVAALVESAASFVRPQTQRGSIALIVELDPEVGEVMADEQKLLQVLINLLSNAVKYTPDSGVVGVCAARCEGRVTISVTDSGPGIALSDQDRIFEEFAQARTPADGRELGTGLGLALARRYTELHAGRLTVDSVLGIGSTFRLEVPVHA
jgi:signal transduction histidine kinase